MIPIQLSTQLHPAITRFSHDFVTHVLARCDPTELLPSNIHLDQPNTRTHILAFGKASTTMAHACAKQLGSRLVGGIVLAPEILIKHSPPHPACHPTLRYFSVDHPTPTTRNIAATKSLIQYAKAIPPEDGCIVCISGGGSAHLCSPKPGITLEQIIQTTTTLNAKGASIHELNQARRSLETLKSGGLAQVLSQLNDCQAIVLSDVLDDDLETIASGPMLNPSVPIPHTIIGNHHTALHAGAEFLRDQNIHIGSLRPLIFGNSGERGRELAQQFANSPSSCAHLIAGESTVNTQGSFGIGGPCLELVLSCALQLTEMGTPDWVVLGLATDGVDGPSGAAGAVISSTMLSVDQCVSARQALDTHDSLSFLNSLNATIITGPTGTNVNDLCLLCPLTAINLND